MLYAGTYFLCRQCHGLAYEVQREDFTSRMRRSADKVRARLGWNSGGSGVGWQKPKGMHWSTFKRLFQEVNRREKVELFAFYKQAQRFMKKCGLDEKDFLSSAELSF